MTVYTGPTASSNRPPPVPTESEETATSDRLLSIFVGKIIASMFFFISACIAIVLLVGLEPVYLVPILLVCMILPLAGLDRNGLHKDTRLLDFYLKGIWWKLNGGMYFYSRKGITAEDITQACEGQAMRLTPRLVMVRKPKDAVALKLVIV